MTYCTTGVSFNYENGLCCYLQTTTATAAAFSLVSGEHRTLPGIGGGVTHIASQRLHTGAVPSQEWTAAGLVVTPSGNLGRAQAHSSPHPLELPALAPRLTRSSSTSKHQGVF